jgi:hypothetical protein
MYGGAPGKERLHCDCAVEVPYLSTTLARSFVFGGHASGSGSTGLAPGDAFASVTT